MTQKNALFAKHLIAQANQTAKNEAGIYTQATAQIQQRKFRENQSLNQSITACLALTNLGQQFKSSINQRLTALVVSFVCAKKS